MNAVTFHVPGKPQGKARAKTVRNKHTGNTMSYTPETDLLYENYIKDRFLNKCNGMFLERGKPVTLRIVARFLPPKSTSKKRTALMLDGKELPLKKPDIDNIVKVVADALNGVAYHDDTQIVMVVAKKVYSSLEGLDVTVEEYKGMGMAAPQEIAEYFDQVCLLQGLPGQTKESMLRDIELGLQYFERVCVNIMVANTKPILPDDGVRNIFIKEIYPLYKDNERVDILLNNTDFGVGV